MEGLLKDCFPTYTGDLGSSLLPKIKEIKNLTAFKREDVAEPEHRNIV